MFVNRQNELAALNDRFSSDCSEFIIIYGRRRVGKTELILNFTKGKPHIYYMADQRNEREQLETFSTKLSEYFNDPVLKIQPLTGWDAALTYIESRKKRNEKLIIILDEYPYLAEINPSISSVMQKHWDEALKNQNVYIILCGSSMSFMEKELLSYKSPLYGRRTGQLEVKPFNIYETAKMFRNVRNKEITEIYGVYGGIPAYLDYHNPKVDLWSNITNNILKPDSLLFNEVYYLLMQELRTPRNYFSILRSVSLGDSKLNDISQRTGIDRQSVIKYIDNLIQLRILERKIPVTDNPLKSRRGLYHIKDNYFKFWFRYIYPHLSLIEEHRSKVILDKIKVDFSVYMGKIFEDVCFHIINKNLKLFPFEIEKLGSWWDKDKEIDILAIGKKGEILFGECKYSNKAVGTDIYIKLKEKSTDIKSNEKYYILFSKKGFTKDMNALARKEKVILVALEKIKFRQK